MTEWLRLLESYLKSNTTDVGTNSDAHLKCYAFQISPQFYQSVWYIYPGSLPISGNSDKRKIAWSDDNTIKPSLSFL
jgi:hypothetical protein